MRSSASKFLKIELKFIFYFKSMAVQITMSNKEYEEFKVGLNTMGKYIYNSERGNFYSTFDKEIRTHF